MKVVVTGGAGYVGAVVTSHLLAMGMEVTVLDALLYGGEPLLAFLPHPGFRFIVGDVRNPDDIRKAVAGADAVVHLAAIVGETACAIDEQLAESVNYGGVETTLSMAAASGVGRFLFVSTCSNYGMSDPNHAADEDAPLRPLSQYARSKVKAEALVVPLRRPPESGPACPSSVSALVFRFGTICGLSPRMRFDLLVSDMARAAILGESIRIFAPAAWRPFLHIRDAARAVELALNAPADRIAGKVFNVVGENCQKQYLADLVRKHFPKADVQVTLKQADLRDYRVTGDRIRTELGFTPQFSVEEAFLETAAAVADGVFREPRWPGYSAVPLTPSFPIS